jgi:maltose O-acetyltransferase
MLRHFLNLLLWVLPPSRLFAMRRLCLRLAGVSVQSGVSVCGRGWIYGRGVVTLGRDSWMSPGVVFHSHLSAPITIGQRCDIGPGVTFIPGGHAIGGSERRAGTGFAKPIDIGDGTWIGAHSVILGGVRVGSGCVIAAGSIVTLDIPDNSLAAGVPAIVKRPLNP